VTITGLGSRLGAHTLQQLKAQVEQEIVHRARAGESLTGALELLGRIEQRLERYEPADMPSIRQRQVIAAERGAPRHSGHH